MATIADVAKRAGVSTATVSHVINRNGRVTEQVRARVEEAIRDLNYRPNGTARALRTQRSQLISLIVPDVANQFYGTLARGVQAVLKARGFHIMLGSTDYERAEEEYFLRIAANQYAAGVILLPFRLREEEVSRYCGHDVPVVIIGDATNYPSLPCVYADNVDGARQAVVHLLEQGRRHIACINGLPDTPQTESRWKGYMQAHQTYGLTPDPSLHIMTDFQRGGGETAMQRLLDSGKPLDAVFATNDLMALGAMRILQQHELRIPDDIALVGFDDIIDAECVRPALTTVRQPTYDMGRYAADLLLRHIDKNPMKASDIILPCTLIHRNSA